MSTPTEDIKYITEQVDLALDRMQAALAIKFDLPETATLHLPQVERWMIEAFAYWVREYRPYQTEEKPATWYGVITDKAGRAVEEISLAENVDAHDAVEYMLRNSTVDVYTVGSITVSQGTRPVVEKSDKDDGVVTVWNMLTEDGPVCLVVHGSDTTDNETRACELAASMYTDKKIGPISLRQVLDHILSGNGQTVEGTYAAQW